MNLFTKTKYVYFGAIAFSLLTAIISGVAVWNIAPEIGGSLWPYIRFGLSLLSGVVVGKIVAIVSFYAASFYFIDELFSFGNADNPWGDAEIENFKDKFEEDE